MEQVEVKNIYDHSAEVLEAVGERIIKRCGDDLESSEEISLLVLAYAEIYKHRA